MWLIALLIVAIVIVVIISISSKRKKNVNYVISELSSKSDEELEKMIRTSGLNLILHDKMVENHTPNAEYVTKYEKYYCNNATDVEKLNKAVFNELKRRGLR